MKTEKIETIKKRFHREWLLIALEKVDESTTTPVSGKLIAYSEDKLPKGYVAAF